MNLVSAMESHPTKWFTISPTFHSLVFYREKYIHIYLLYLRSTLRLFRNGVQMNLLFAFVYNKNVLSFLESAVLVIYSPGFLYPYTILDESKMFPPWRTLAFWTYVLSSDCQNWQYYKDLCAEYDDIIVMSPTKLVKREFYVR